MLYNVSSDSVKKFSLNTEVNIHEQHDVVEIALETKNTNVMFVKNTFQKFSQSRSGAFNQGKISVLKEVFFSTTKPILASKMGLSTNCLELATFLFSSVNLRVATK